MDALDELLENWNEDYLDYLRKARYKLLNGDDIVVEDLEQFRQQGETLIRHYDSIGITYSPYYRTEDRWSFVKVARDVLSGVKPFEKTQAGQTVVADHDSWGSW